MVETSFMDINIHSQLKRGGFIINACSKHFEQKKYRLKPLRG